MQKATLTWGKNKWVLDDDYTIKGAWYEITVPKGFRTDLASVPRLLWAVFPPFGAYNEAALVHDYLYKKTLMSRKESDKIFLDIMKTYKVGFIIRWSYYLAVRVFGWLSYGKTHCA